MNDHLKALYFVCYDQRFVMFSDPKDRKSTLDYFVIEVKRKEMEAEIAEYLEYERATLKEVDEIVNQLTF